MRLLVCEPAYSGLSNGTLTLLPGIFLGFDPISGLKLYTIWTFGYFNYKIGHTIYLAPNNFWNPIFGQVVSFYELTERDLGI